MAMLKQSTASTVVLGPFVDSTDGATAETALTISQADIRLSKNGGAFAQTNNAAGATHMENGHYSVPLNTTDTDTLGRLRVAVSESGALPVWRDFEVVPANVWDSLFGADKLQVHADEITAGLITAAAIATNAIDADAIAADAVTELQSGLATAAALATVDDFLDTEIADIQARLPAALVSGRIDASVGAMAANTLTAAAIAADAITAAKIATDAIDADALAANAVTEIQSGLATTANVAAVETDTQDIQARLPAALVGGRIDASVGAVAANAITAASLAADAGAEIADAVWDEALAGHAGAGSTGAALSAAGSAGDPWSTALPGAYGAGTAGSILGTNLDATVSSRASQASVNTIDDLLDTEVAALQTSVNDLPTNAELATALAAADDAVLAAINALNNLSAAQVNAEVLDVLSTDVQTELASLPAAATTLTNMLKTLYAYTTNEVRETSSLQTLRNRANSATIATHNVTDDGTTYVRGSGS